MKIHKFHQREVMPLKDKKIPPVWMFTDTETKVREVNGSDRHLFYMGWVFLCMDGWEEDNGPFYEHYFDSSREYLRYIHARAIEHSSVMLCGHNIFFDLQAAGFFRYFSDHGWTLDYLYDKGLTFIMKIVKDLTAITVVSTTNWFDCSAADLGDMLNMPKLHVNLGNVSDIKLREYCYRDTEIIMNGMRHYIRFIRDNSLGKLCLTKASQSLTAYRHSYMNERIFIHDDEKVHSLERDAYMGGRTEAFFIGHARKNSYVSLDINSMYPYVMQKYMYPSRLVGYMEDEPWERYTAPLKGFLMIADVDLHTSEPVYAVRHRGKTVFPVGDFRTCLCTEGIKYALDHGHIKTFYRASIYRGADLFSSYVKAFYDLRLLYIKSGEKVMEKLCKYMHNSMYGKWGERKVVTEKYESDRNDDYFRDEVYDMVKGGKWIETYLFGVQMLQRYEGETAHSAPAIAAHVTENARLELWSLMTKIGREHVLYCDTDNVIINEKHAARVKDIIDVTALGKLKVQARFSSLDIQGAKNYRTDAVRHIKGIPATAKEVEPGVFEYMHFKRMCMCLRERVTEGVPAEVKQRKLRSPYDKGTVTSSGRVEPLVFPLPDQPV